VRPAARSAARLRYGFAEAAGLLGAAVRELTWRRVLTAEAVGLIANVFRYLEGSSQTFREVLASTIFTTVAPFLLVLVALCAAEAVRRGTPPLRAYSLALAGATCASASTQFVCRQALAIHAKSGSASAAVQEWVWIGSDVANVILLGGIALLAFYNHRSVERILLSVRTAELKRVRLERELIESRLATAQAQIDPRTLFESLARIRNLYGSSPPEADRMLQNLIETLRSQRAAIATAPAADGLGS
jgi:hypothetical protein